MLYVVKIMKYDECDEYDDDIVNIMNYEYYELEHYEYWEHELYGVFIYNCQLGCSTYIRRRQAVTAPPPFATIGWEPMPCEKGVGQVLLEKGQGK